VVGACTVMHLQHEIISADNIHSTRPDSRTHELASARISSNHGSNDERLQWTRIHL